MTPYSKLQQFIFEKATETKLPSVTISLIKDRKVVWSGAAGYKNLETGAAATPETLYGIGSVTKSFTVMAVCMLAEQGKLALDDPIDKYVPFPVKPFGEPIRIWHLLSHSSGIPALGHAEGVIRAMTGNSSRWFPAAVSNDLLSFLDSAGDWVLAKPGERWFYLNEGYELVGAAIECVTGLPYIEFVRQNIVLPLGMARTFYRKEDVDKDLDVAVPYVHSDDGKPVPSTYPYGSVVAAGGMISSVMDMAKVISMHLNWGEYPGGRLVSKKSLQEMQTPRVPTAHKDGPFGNFEYGLGFFLLSNFLGRPLVDHSGSVHTATAYMGLIPEEKVGVMVMANSSGYSTRFIGQYGLAILLGQDPEELSFVKRDRLMSGLCGNYETFRGTTNIQIKRSGDFLMMVEAGKYSQATTILIPASLEEGKSIFYTLGNGYKVYAEFVQDRTGTSLVFERYAYRKTGSLKE